MVIDSITKGAFYWLRAPRSSIDLRTDERILALIRLLLSVCCVIAVFHPGIASDSRIYVIAAFLYLGFAVFVLAALSSRRTMPPLSHLYIHCLDILWASQLICFVSLPLLVSALLFFVMVSTAFRWGFWEAALTFVSFCTLALLGSYFYYPPFLSTLPAIARGEHLSDNVIHLVMICMIGVLAEAKALRSESFATGRAIGNIRLKAGLEQALRAMGREGIQMYGATQFLVVLHDKARNKALLFRTIRPQSALQSCELDPTQYARYSFPEPGTSVRVAIAHSSGRNKFRCRALEAGKMRTREIQSEPPKSFLEAHPFRLLLAASFVPENDWTIRIFVVDPIPFFGGTAGLRFLERNVRLVGPAIGDLFNLSRLASRAKAAASGQFARELHDGIIQSLSVINMQLEDLKEKFGSLSQPGGITRVDQIQQAVQTEIAGLRDFTQQLRSLELDSQNLLSFLAGMAVKFQIEHGIATRFVADVEEIHLAPRTCVEVARIVQEALANVRKHSEAREALVRLTKQNGNYVLSILDNGRGFSFSGHRSHEELQASGEGPIVLMDRAKTIGAKVSIESFEDHGTCIEVVVPMQ